MPGMYFEEFAPGMVIDHEVRRTVTEADNILFSTMTLNMAPLHLDAEYSAGSIHGQRLVNSLFLLGLVSGISMQNTTFGTTLGNLGFDSVKFPKPTFHGDTIRVQTEIVAARESKSRNDSGIVTFRHLGINQRDEVVCDAVRVGLMLKKTDDA
ncbi:MaoC family dehydratase [Gordonia sp. zg691]|uniref:MaoC family dehydratase n=1 Tax=Gordonia jinghuaiqii TaxID=2758710 RepID=A0A7D7LX48_9ACTN|nr:MaoC family dehydratase [Gordonia jinghuaiqii]MBD0863128.1 MaoC family dehydratase [Gordonia jinghuaiqii]MCR5980361.1 MaoC family dehydratase [Gordonia jinghuaiqii]QMT01898.1 MaoC family dehydratase [Gordonia jinghuaiqii]